MFEELRKEIKNYDLVNRTKNIIMDILQNEEIYEKISIKESELCKLSIIISDKYIYICDYLKNEQLRICIEATIMYNTYSIGTITCVYDSEGKYIDEYCCI